MPVVAARADALREGGLDAQHTYPKEQRSAGSDLAAFVALRLLDAGATLTIEHAAKRIAARTREWMQSDLEPVMSARGNATPPTILYGPGGEVLLDIAVATDEDG